VTLQMTWLLLGANPIVCLVADSQEVLPSFGSLRHIAVPSGSKSARVPDHFSLLLTACVHQPGSRKAVQLPPISSTAPVAVSSDSPPFFPKYTLERAKLALVTWNVPEQSVFKYGRW